VHFFVTSDGHRKLTTQFNIEGDPLIWDDFAYATREELIPHVTTKPAARRSGLKADAYKDIAFDFSLTPLVQGKDNQIVERPRAAATRNRPPRDGATPRAVRVSAKINHTDARKPCRSRLAPTEEPTCPRRSTKPTNWTTC
jgi:hypothetical protein